MKIATIRRTNATATVVVDSPTTGRLIPGISSVQELLQSPTWRTIAESASQLIHFAPQDLAPVIPRPEKIICVGLNYAQHIREMGRELPEVPTLFIKFADALTGPFDTVTIPESAAACLDAEAELAVIIGSTAHRVSAEEAHSHIAGYALMNDYTQRDWQRRTLQFHQGKSYFRSSGFGPWMTTADAFDPTRAHRLTCHWDQELFQEGSTDDLIFSCAELVSFCSQIYPLNPGDVIATGTPHGVGFAREPQRFIRSGQTVRIAIEGLGEIANRTVIVPDTQ
ncbi:fumarylacetoacetate hydrolase family protein [Corynebacterium felinum]|uniref:Acylpyruvate hydrolase n=1 Tax=Corynebacterium felinum TaxID=131318 RepID=A0ABU2B936_9CORY|nr:fumarylacetoacetate hydrolase family protein [Corynebacterium felinum]MDF5821042.1 fumarylacetoacetate hydrolase family protein [Corynebacterium felinum]MDR7355128.1 acylpyruvate hydrolase [Corynebacterium felinum]WJY94479.1 Ureidoglycolate lyase [Corynebacterium felinum]